MATLLADPPGAASSEQQPTPGSSGGAPAPSSETTSPVQSTCANCGAPMDGAQDWCLQCGAGAPDSLSTRSPSWRSAAAVLSVVALLMAGAATAAYAALSKGNGKAVPSSTTVAQITTPASPTPAPSTTPQPTPTAPSKVETPTTVAPTVSPSAVTPPKIPLTAATPQPTGTSSPSTPAPSATAPTATTPSNGTSNASSEPQEALLLDTDAAATYNPYGYPAGNFGDPSLAIDGDPTTGWTALVEPAVAPKMAEGVVIDLNTARKLSALALTTSTPGMTVQIYGANGPTLPTSITDPAWVALSPSLLEKKKHVRIKLGGTSSASKQAARKPYRYVTLWISGAPAASVGTAQAPGHVSIDELELFPFKK